MKTLVSGQSISKKALEVLDMLDRWDERLQEHLDTKRNRPRSKFRRRVMISLSESNSQDHEGSRAASPQIEGISRNLSQAGMALISQHVIKELNVTICLNPDEGGNQTLRGEKVSTRQVQNDFWEYGIRFVKQATDTETSTT
ncbi:MAG: PilZ domain-containing protein [Planctomycetota bacterium]|nr:PilZ domain-containing protein [Planctomycetota bacterium]